MGSWRDLRGQALAAKQYVLQIVGTLDRWPIAWDISLVEQRIEGKRVWEEMGVLQGIRGRGDAVIRVCVCVCAVIRAGML